NSRRTGKSYVSRLPGQKAWKKNGANAVVPRFPETGSFPLSCFLPAACSILQIAWACSFLLHFWRMHAKGRALWILHDRDAAHLWNVKRRRAHHAAETPDLFHRGIDIRHHDITDPLRGRARMRRLHDAAETLAIVQQDGVFHLSTGERLRGPAK